MSTLSNELPRADLRIRSAAAPRGARQTVRSRRLRHLGKPRPGSSTIVAVVTDSLEDVAVARTAAELADRPGARLVLAVPVPAEGLLFEQGLLGPPGDPAVPADARAAIGRVRPVLERYGVTYAVLPVSFRDRGGPRRRSRRIASALLRTAQGLRARRLVVGAYACWEPTGPRVADRLAAAQRAQRAGRVTVTVVDPAPDRVGGPVSTGDRPSASSSRAAAGY